MGSEETVVTDCMRCPALVEQRTQIVNGTGPLDAELLFVGEAPGEQEDATGTPFVGRSGTLLTETLTTHGVARGDVRITNSVRCRPPDNRDPTDQELAHCRGYLLSEITAVDPTVIVTLGKVPSENLLQRSVTVTTEAGSLVEVTLGETTRQVLIGIHPAATLYDRGQQSTFETVIERAVELTDAGNQAQLDEFGSAE